VLNTFNRYERKYLMNQAEYEALTTVLLQYMKPDKFCRGDQWYSIYNIYYDTANHDIIRRSLAKPYYKEKLRLRSYTVPGVKDEPVFLELKKKIGGVVAKRRAIMGLDEACEFVVAGQRPAGSGYLNNQVTEEIACFLHCNRVGPKVFIGYERRAFFGKEDENLRVTFDRHIVTRRKDLALESGSYGKRLLEEGQYLMEIKMPGAIPLWLSSVLAEHMLYSTSFSKYGTEFKNYCRENLCVS